MRSGKLVVLVVSLTSALSCYVFPPEQEDPCKDHKCQFGARCVASPDGKSGECKCPESCPSLGDHVGSRPVCGSDGLDYKNTCELRRSACLSSTQISVKYQGKCGEYFSCYNYYFFIFLFGSCRPGQQVERALIEPGEANGGVINLFNYLFVEFCQPLSAVLTGRALDLSQSSC